MKPGGVVRKIDELGRIVIPIELRKSIEIGKRDAVEISIENDSIRIKKYEPGCCLCGSGDNIVYFKGNKVCNECITKIDSGDID